MIWVSALGSHRHPADGAVRGRAFRPSCLAILPKKIGIKNSIYLSLAVYTLISILGYFMTKEIHFILLGLGVASVQGGSQALSRSLMGKLMPNSKSAEFYGFFSVSEKFNSIIGPALFSAITFLTGNGRLAILSLIVFFMIGIFVLSRSMLIAV